MGMNLRASPGPALPPRAKGYVTHSESWESQGRLLPLLCATSSGATLEAIKFVIGPLIAVLDGVAWPQGVHELQVGLHGIGGLVSEPRIQVDPGQVLEHLQTLHASEKRGFLCARIPRGGLQLAAVFQTDIAGELEEQPVVGISREGPLYACQKRVGIQGTPRSLPGLHEVAQLGGREFVMPVGLRQDPGIVPPVGTEWAMNSSASGLLRWMTQAPCEFLYHIAATAFYTTWGTTWARHTPAQERDS